MEIRNEKILIITTRAVVDTDWSETKTETAKFFRDQDRDRQSSRPRQRQKNDVIIGVFDIKKKIWGLKFAHKLVL